MLCELVYISSGLNCVPGYVLLAAGGSNEINSVISVA